MLKHLWWLFTTESARGEANSSILMRNDFFEADLDHWLNKQKKKLATIFLSYETFASTILSDEYSDQSDG